MPEVAPIFCPDGLLGTFPFPVTACIPILIGYKLKSGDYVSIDVVVVNCATTAMIKCHTNDVFSFFEVERILMPPIISKVITRSLSPSIIEI